MSLLSDSGLTLDDVQRLAGDASSATRAETAAKLALSTSRVDLTDTEKALAQDIFRLFAKDTALQVREALADNLRSSKLLPRDVAMTLARDVESVALPILEASEVLTTEDLVEIVKSRNAPKQVAIAGRKSVSSDVSAALVEHGDEQAVTALIDNPGAHITEPTMHLAVDRFGDAESVQESLVKRAALPITVAERLVTLVADHLRGELLARHQVSPDLLSDIVLQSSERVTAGLTVGASDQEINALITQLGNNGRLTPSLVLRSICLGNLKFFEQAMATLAGIPLPNARLLAHDPGGSGLDTLCQRAGLPEAYCAAVKIAVRTVDETPLGSGANGAARYSRRIIERILTQYECADAEFEGDDLEYLLGKLSQTKPAAANLH
jgi:uncharacterized protein (DUF2336 family)